MLTFSKKSLHSAACLLLCLSLAVCTWAQNNQPAAAPPAKILASAPAHESAKKDLPVPPSSFTEAEAAISPYTPLFQGVSLAEVKVPGIHASVAYALRIDLRAPGISFLSTRHQGAKATIAETTQTFAQKEHLQAAINTGFFSPCCSAKPEEKNILGLTISDGVILSSLATNGKYQEALLIGKDNSATIKTVTHKTALSRVAIAVSGSAILVHNGKNAGTVNRLNGAAVSNPRTLVGLSRDGRFLYWVVVDGRKPGYSIGTTNTESATILLALGVWTGLNLDGGGSTIMVREDEKGRVVPVNRPSGGNPRWVAASLGLRALPLNPPNGKAH